MRFAFVAFTLTGVIACGGGEEGSVPQIEPHVMQGRFTLSNAVDCKYGSLDFTADTEVTLRNEADEILAVSALGSPETLEKSDGRPTCVFQFELTDVPTARFYTLKIQGRDGPTVPYDDLVADDWRLCLHHSAFGPGLPFERERPPYC